MITVKVIQVPGKVVEIALEDGATVAQALIQADVEQGEGEALKVDNVDATPDQTLSEGQRVIVAKAAKGNA
tara:strand:+ start:9560 stop:9772 length:213 start_codon:yes stop_codon:yes gene_type:complete